MAHDNEGSLTPPDVHLPRPARVRGRDNPRWIAALAALVFAISFSVFVYTNVRTNRTVDNSATVIGQLKTVADSNKDVLDRIDHNQAGIDELVNFVHEVEAQQPQQGNGQSQVVNQLEQILCSSSDPIRIEACQRLGITPIPGG